MDTEHLDSQSGGDMPWDEDLAGIPDLAGADDLSNLDKWLESVPQEETLPEPDTAMPDITTPDTPVPGAPAASAPRKKVPSYVWKILAGALVLILAAVLFCMSRYVLVGFHLYPRDASALDLRGRTLTAAQYDRLSRSLPDCEITWNVPFQGAFFPNTATTLTVDTLSQEDVATLDYFPDLETVDARACADYANLKALADRRPEVEVDYSITLGGQPFDPAAREITLTGIGEEEVPQVAYLENLESLTVRGGKDTGGYSALQSYCHDNGIPFLVQLGEEAVEDDVTHVTARYVLDADLELLPLLKDLTRLELVNPLATPETVFSLDADTPGVKVSWNVQVGGMTITPEVTEVDLSTVKVTDLEQVEQAMAYLPHLQTLFMGEQDISHDDMAAFRDRVRDQYKVVWYIRLGNSVPIRTDITYFMPGRDCYKLNVMFTDATSYNIRYCEDLICVDVGHLGVSDVSWVATLTNLEYLILAHTNVQYIDGIENCKKLKFLELDWSGIRTLEPLKGCTALEDLNIGHAWPDVSALKEMPWLKNVYMIFGSSKAAYELAVALPDTHVVSKGTATVSSGWRRLPNYYAMRDALHAPYMN